MKRQGRRERRAASTRNMVPGRSRGGDEEDSGASTWAGAGGRLDGRLAGALGGWSMMGRLELTSCRALGLLKVPPQTRTLAPVG